MSHLDLAWEIPRRALIYERFSRFYRPMRFDKLGHCAEWDRIVVKGCFQDLRPAAMRRAVAPRTRGRQRPIPRPSPQSPRRGNTSTCSQAAKPPLGTCRPSRGRGPSADEGPMESKRNPMQSAHDSPRWGAHARTSGRPCLPCHAQWPLPHARRQGRSQAYAWALHEGRD